MENVLIVAVVLLALALIYACNLISKEKSAKNALYRYVTLPKHAQTVALPRAETPEYKLEQALRREVRLQESCDSLTAENAALRDSYEGLKREFFQLFGQGRQVVDGFVQLMQENERLSQRLLEETLAKELALLKLKRAETGSPVYPN